MARIFFLYNEILYIAYLHCFVILFLPWYKMKLLKSDNKPVYLSTAWIQNIDVHAEEQNISTISV